LGIETKIDAVITVGCDEEEIGKALSIANRYEKILVSIGYHPYEVDKVTREHLENLKRFTKGNDDKAVAIAKCGLDYYRDYTSKENQ
jgi:Tat protein secretion system quality control protein TatD with DNase activity